jgi:hypothetical protein
VEHCVFAGRRGDGVPNDVPKSADLIPPNSTEPDDASLPDAPAQVVIDTWWPDHASLSHDRVALLRRAVLAATCRL